MKIIIQAISKFFSFLRWILPHIITAILFAVECMLKCISGQFKGMAEAANREADERTAEVMEGSKIPLEYEKHVRWVMLVIAWSLLLFGYVLVCHVVVWIAWRVL